MNHSEEASVSCTAPVPSNPRHVIEDLVLINASAKVPRSLYTTTPVGSGLRSRFSVSSGMQHQPEQRDVTTRRRVIQGDPTGAEQPRLFRIETESAETELQAERTADAQLPVAQLATEMVELQARTSVAAEALASCRPRLHVLHRQSTTPKSPHSNRSPPRVRWPSPS